MLHGNGIHIIPDKNYDYQTIIFGIFNLLRRISEKFLKSSNVWRCILHEKLNISIEECIHLINNAKLWLIAKYFTFEGDWYEYQIIYAKFIIRFWINISFALKNVFNQILSLTHPKMIIWHTSNSYYPVGAINLSE